MRTRCARLVKRLGALVCALLVAVQAVGMPRAKAVVAEQVGRMTCQAFLESLGLSQVVTGTAADGLAGVANRGITSLAGRYVAATGVASSASGFFASIAPYVAAFAGGYTIGSIGYTLVSEFVDWLIDDSGLNLTDDVINVYAVNGDVLVADDGTKFNLGYLLTNTPVDDLEESGYSVGSTVPAGHYTFGNGKYTFDASYNDNGTVSVSYDVVNRGEYTYKGTVSFVYSNSSKTKIGYANLTIDYYWLRGWESGMNLSNVEIEHINEDYSIRGVPDIELPALQPDQEYRVDVGAPPGTSLDDLVTMVPDQIADGTITATGTIVTPGEDTPPSTDIPTINPNPPASDVTPDQVKPATVALGMIFPFCIPFDVYHMVTLLVAEPEAPNGRWEFALPWDPGSQYVVEWDLEDYNDVAALLRTMELILFAVGLAALTRRYIKW